MSDGEKIHDWIQQNKSRMLQLVAELVRFNTVNHVVSGTELQLQLYVERLFREQLKLDVDLFSPDEVPGIREHPAYFQGRDYKDRPNVVGKWKGQGGGKSLLFSSHADTAPVAPGWTHDPCDPVVKDGRLYGLGSFDMKGGLAASILAVACVQELGLRLMGDVTIESVVDEEFGGANGTLACRLRGYNADAAIIPEPTNMAVCPASRGGALWRATFRGTTGMSFSGEAVYNPVYDAGTFIAFLQFYEKERSSLHGPSPWYERIDSLPVMITRVEAGDMTAVLCDSGPAECHVDIWVECYPGVTEAQLQQELFENFSRHCKRNGIALRGNPELTKMIRFLPGSDTPTDFPLIALLAEEITRVTGQEAAIHGAPFACDAFIFNLHSPTPALIVGPVGGNAHSAGEFLDVAQFYELVEVYARTIVNWCGKADG